MKHFSVTNLGGFTDAEFNASTIAKMLVCGGQSPIFRSVHSIKGGAGTFGFDELVAFSHIFESLLEALSEGKMCVERRGGTEARACRDCMLLEESRPLEIQAAPSHGGSLKEDCPQC